MGEAGPPSPLSYSVPSESVSCFNVYTSLSHTLSLLLFLPTPLCFVIAAARMEWALTKCWD